MPHSAPSNQPPTVFISYAHESDTLRAFVAALAEWLRGHGCRVFTDHPYVDRPPPEGWQAWMRGCIEEADAVLVVCTPKLKGRYEKTAAPGAGRGITYEGALVTQRMYDDAMRNTKFFPLLPEGGSEDDIPTTLRPWWNGHRFPGGNEGIRRMVFAQPAGLPEALPAGSAETGASPWSIGDRHQRLVARLLGVTGALPFFQALQNEMAGEFTGTPAPRTAAAMVQRLTECPAGQVLDLFVVVRRALLAVSPTDPLRQAAEEAAAALYCLAACRLVDRAAHVARGPGASAYVIDVPSSERVVCAIIATALFGGELRLIPAEQPGLPRPEYVFEVRVPAGGDQIATDFERATYVAMFPNDRAATEISLDSGPLGPQERARLAACLRTITKVRRASMALVVHGLAPAEAVQGFAGAHQVPVMLPATEATTALLGMDASTLLAEIREFWAELQVLPRPASQPPARSPGPPPP
jgi:hypothetical protein